MSNFRKPGKVRDSIRKALDFGPVFVADAKALGEEGFSKNNHNRGKKLSPEVRARISAGIVAAYARARK